jgi:hypothetical protein
MTDLSHSTPMIIRKVRLPRLSLPRLRLGAAAASLLSAYGKAMDMAYVAPYTGAASRQGTLPETDDGRNPDW